MTEIWAEWTNGEVECVDCAESESEAINLVSEYRMAYGQAARRIWVQEEGHAGAADENRGDGTHHL